MMIPKHSLSELPRTDSFPQKFEEQNELVRGHRMTLWGEKRSVQIVHRQENLSSAMGLWEFCIVVVCFVFLFFLQANSDISVSN